MDKRILTSNTHLQLLPKGGGLDTEVGELLLTPIYLSGFFKEGKNRVHL